MSEHWSPQKIDQLEALLTARDSQILDSLEQFRALSTRLIQRLHFPVGEHGLHRTERTATRLANRVLLRLESHGFIARIERRVGGPVRGSAGQIWHLAAAGDRVLRARRGDRVRRRFIAPSRTFLAHTLAVAELVAAAKETGAAGAFEVLEVETEPTCWRRFQGSLGLLTLKPDLLVVVANADLEAHVFVEIDRSTENLPAILKKTHL